MGYGSGSYTSGAAILSNRDGRSDRYEFFGYSESLAGPAGQDHTFPVIGYHPGKWRCDRGIYEIWPEYVVWDPPFESCDFIGKSAAIRDGWLQYGVTFQGPLLNVGRHIGEYVVI